MNKKSDVELKALLEEVTANDQNEAHLNKGPSDDIDGRVAGKDDINSKGSNRFSLSIHRYTIRFGIITLIICIALIVSFFLFSEELMSVF